MIKKKTKKMKKSCRSSLSASSPSLVFEPIDSEHLLLSGSDGTRRRVTKKNALRLFLATDGVT